ncbi:MAG: hypothetical protein CL931_16170 [Deltaproteobacteria bacterium]|nr:hypothetical protein [Deltaproteobacteria bacterium]
MLKKFLLLCAALSAFIAGPALAQNSAVINFSADLTSYSGVPGLNPFTAGTPVNDLVNGNFGSVQDGVNRPDWLNMDGQIVIPDFTGDGTYTITPDGLGDGGIFLFSPILNRVETVSWRTEAGITTPGFGRADGNTPTQRDDIYFPDFSPNGTATVTIAGNDVSIDYDLDFNNLPTTNAEFLRSGVTPTDISNVLSGFGATFSNISVLGSGTATTSFEAKGGTSATTPFGGYTSLTDGELLGNLSNTIVGTTLGMLENEINNGNISSDGRNLPSTVFMQLAEIAPFNTPGGTNIFFDLSGTPLDASVTVVPEPSTALLAMLGLAGLSAAGRRKTA